jgi:hypothetical protein
MSNERIHHFSNIFYVENQETARRHQLLPGQVVIVVRNRSRWIHFLCPCGCAEALAINIDPLSDSSWKLIQEQQFNAISLMPSIWRTTNCEAHFVIWRNHIYFCDSDEDLPEDAVIELREEWRRIRANRHYSSCDEVY